MFCWVASWFLCIFWRSTLHHMWGGEELFPDCGLLFGLVDCVLWLTEASQFQEEFPFINCILLVMLLSVVPDSFPCFFISSTPSVLIFFIVSILVFRSWTVWNFYFIMWIFSLDFLAIFKRCVHFLIFFFLVCLSFYFFQIFCLLFTSISLRYVSHVLFGVLYHFHEVILKVIHFSFICIGL